MKERDIIDTTTVSSDSATSFSYGFTTRSVSTNAFGSICDLPYSTKWNTKLFQRRIKQFTNSKINMLQGKLRLQRGAHGRSMIELEIMRQSDTLRRLNRVV